MRNGGVTVTSCVVHRQINKGRCRQKANEFDLEFTFVLDKDSGLSVLKISTVLTGKHSRIRSVRKQWTFQSTRMPCRWHLTLVFSIQAGPWRRKKHRLPACKSEGSACLLSLVSWLFWWMSNKLQLLYSVQLWPPLITEAEIFSKAFCRWPSSVPMCALYRVFYASSRLPNLDMLLPKQSGSSFIQIYL